MKIHNPKDYVLHTSKANLVWEILPKSTVEFTAEESQNMEVDPDIIILEKDTLLEDIS